MTSDLNQKTGQALKAQCQALAEAIIARQYRLQPEIWEPYGEVGREKSLRDAIYHLSYLAESIIAADPSLFVDYIVWAKTLFAGLKLPDGALVDTLRWTREALKETLSPEMMALTDQYIEAALNRISITPATPATFLNEKSSLGQLGQHYLQALRRGERHTASHLILEQVENGVSIKDIYLQVFQPVQYEIGHLWQTNQISVAQEHYCTAATQLVMSQLYPYIFATEKIGHKLVAACVGGELHEIGIRMVADFFELEGWDTYYLGANTPAASVLDMINERQADVLAISATMTFHISAVSELIDHVRASNGQKLKILVGGYPFNVSPNLWQRLGADGSARNAQEAITLAQRLISQEDGQ